MQNYYATRSIVYSDLTSILSYSCNNVALTYFTFWYLQESATIPYGLYCRANIFWCITLFTSWHSRYVIKKLYLLVSGFFSHSNLAHMETCVFVFERFSICCTIKFHSPITKCLNRFFKGQVGGFLKANLV